MLVKNYSKDGKTCKVTFSLPAEVKAKTATLCGEFTNWEENPKKMTHHKDGSFSTSVTLKVNKEYLFRYLLDGERWENDWQADAYVSNEFGSDDSLVIV
jgi:1,4-alpha-glucan branching enzyme